MHTFKDVNIFTFYICIFFKIILQLYCNVYCKNLYIFILNKSIFISEKDAKFVEIEVDKSIALRQIFVEFVL